MVNSLRRDSSESQEKVFKTMNTSLDLMNLAKVEKGVLAFDSSFFKNKKKFRVLSNYRPAIVPRSKLTNRTRYLYQGYVRNNEFFFDESSCNKLFGFEINFLIEHFFKRFLKDIN